MEILKDLKISVRFRDLTRDLEIYWRFRDLLEICQDLSIYTGFRDLGKIFRICSRLYEISIGVIPLGASYDNTYSTMTMSYLMAKYFKN